MPKPKTQPEPRTLSSKRGFVWLAAVAVLTLTAVLGPRTESPAQDAVRLGSKVDLNDSLPPEARGITVVQNLGEVIPTNLPLTDSDGQAIKTGYIFNGNLPTIVTLNYSDCPMLCSVQLNKLTESLNQLDLQLNKDFKILTVSIDPNETSRRAAETKDKYVSVLSNQPGAEQGWTFATAKQPIITKLAGVITRYSLSIDFPPEQLKLALVEAGEGTVGNAVDQFILWCYSYDPDSNSYTPHAWRIMRLCGAGFIGVLLTALVPYWVGRKGKPQLSDQADPETRVPGSDSQVDGDVRSQNDS